MFNLYIPVYDYEVEREVPFFYDSYETYEDAEDAAVNMDFKINEVWITRD